MGSEDAQHLGHLPQLEQRGDGVGHEHNAVHAVGVEQVQVDDHRLRGRRDDRARREADHLISPLPEAHVVLEGEQVEDDVQQADDLHDQEAVDALLRQQLADLVELLDDPGGLAQPVEHARHCARQPVPAEGHGPDGEPQRGVRSIRVARERRRVLAQQREALDVEERRVPPRALVDVAADPQALREVRVRMRRVVRHHPQLAARAREHIVRHRAAGVGGHQSEVFVAVGVVCGALEQHVRWAARWQRMHLDQVNPGAGEQPLRVQRGPQILRARAISSRRRQELEVHPERRLLASPHRCRHRNEERRLELQRLDGQILSTPDNRVANPRRQVHACVGA